MKYAAVILAALVLVLGSQALGRADAPAGVQKWEYRLIVIAGSPESLAPDPKIDGTAKAMAEQMTKLGFEVVDIGAFRKFLTDAGAAGWEVVGFDGQGWAFKRPLK